MVFPEKSIFFAIKGAKIDGHKFIKDLYQKGVHCFVVNTVDESLYPKAQFICRDNVVAVLQAFAKHHRQQFAIPTIAITGSNGKTILKEWLYQLLQNDYTIIKSPKSYNSQIGVPLSVLGMNQKHDLAIFEAGISQVGEMEHLQKIIQPTIGVFTNIGKAHATGFGRMTQKINEKLLLFFGCDTLIYRYDHEKIREEIIQRFPKEKCLSWGASLEADIPIFIKEKKGNSTVVEIQPRGQNTYLIQLPFSTKAAIENCLHAVVVLLHLGIPIQEVEKRLAILKDVPMRLELKEGMHNCNIIDDSYNNDFEGLKIALDFLKQKHKNSPQYSKTLIFSDILESKQDNLYVNIAALLQEHSIQKIIGIGRQLIKQKWLFSEIKEQYFFETTADFLKEINQSISFRQETILLKGARQFEFERIAQRLKKRTHSTTLEISLSALAHNLQCYKQLLKPTTKIMVMVKASAYGSGSFEVAQLLQYHHVDYLGVAYVDEGIVLRQQGIRLPIMVMNPSESEFELLCQYDLEPTIYSFEILEAFRAYLNKNERQNYPIHLELDTGMCRLGFVAEDLPNLIEALKTAIPTIQIKSIFSHLAASDDLEHQNYTQQQIQLYQKATRAIEKTLGINPIKHILNSAGIIAYGEYQMDMVRLGIGIYGIDPHQKMPQLQNVAQFKTTISQIKTIGAAQTIGYSRKGKLPKEGKIAVIAVGYADGFLRAFGNGKVAVSIQNQKATTVGNICMDMCFVDVTHIPTAKAGDEVIIFDDNTSIYKLAAAIDTIPYEILTNINDRVPRLFYED